MFTSLRMTHATKMAVEWLSRVNGLSMNSAFAHALAIEADATKHKGTTFDDAYSESEGVWWCNLYLIGLTREASDEHRARFVGAHMPFFFKKQNGGKWTSDHQKIEALWSHVDYLADHWHKRKEIDAYATGEKMQEILKEARITPPAWGPKAEIE